MHSLCARHYSKRLFTYINVRSSKNPLSEVLLPSLHPPLTYIFTSGTTEGQRVK